MASLPSASDLRAVVKALGGPGVVARALGTSGPNVGNWQIAGEVAASWRLEFWRLCAARGIAWHPPGFETVRLVVTEAATVPRDCGETTEPLSQPGRAA